MNVLTSPIFIVQDHRGVRHLMSYMDIMRGDCSGMSFQGPNPLQHLGQIWLATAITEAIVNPELLEFPKDSIEEIIEYLEEHLDEEKPHFEVFGDGNRFLQAKFEDLSESKEVDTFSLFNLDSAGGSTKRSFHKKPVWNGEGYCSACAAKELFMFQMTCSGAGKGGGGLVSSGLFTVAIGEDARDTILLNTTDPTNSYKINVWEFVKDRRSPHKYPWDNPNHLAALRSEDRNEYEVGISSPLITRESLRFWMSRRVFLLPRELEQDTICRSCGMLTNTDVGRVLEGKTKAGGAFKADKVTKLIGPFNPQDKKGKKGEETQSVRGSRTVQQLLGVSEDILLNDAAPVLKACSDRGELPRTVWALSLVSDKAFMDAFTTHLPIEHRNFTHVGRCLADMYSQGRQAGTALWAAFRTALGSNPKKFPLAQAAMDEFDQAREQFALFLNFSDEAPFVTAPKWSGYLWKTARRLYQTALSGNLAGHIKNGKGNALHRGRAFAWGYYKLIPNTKEPPMSDKKTEDTNLLRMWRHYQAQRTKSKGLKRVVRDIHVTTHSVETVSGDVMRMFSRFLPPHTGTRFKRTEEAILLGIACLFEDKIRHQEGVSLGEALQNMSVKRRDSFSDRVNRLFEQEDIYSFLQEFDPLLGLNTSRIPVGMDLNRLYWDLVLAYHKRTPKTKMQWFKDFYRPKAK